MRSQLQSSLIFVWRVHYALELAVNEYEPMYFLMCFFHFVLHNMTFMIGVRLRLRLRDCSGVFSTIFGWHRYEGLKKSMFASFFEERYGII